MMVQRLFCIRHGETVGDVEDRFGGAYDDELSPEGHAQCKLLVSELKNENLGVVYSSSLKRALGTAKYVADAAGCTVKPVDGVRERDQYGPMTGMTKAEAKVSYPEMVEAVKDRLNTLPGAESYADFSVRVSEAFAQLTTTDVHDVAAIVWHGGGMRVLFRDILKVGELKKIGDCCWVELWREGNGWRVGRMVRLERE